MKYINRFGAKLIFEHEILHCLVIRISRLNCLCCDVCSEQSNMCTSSCHASSNAEAELFSRYKALNVDGVIQQGSNE